MTHSSIDEAEFACRIASEAPVFSDADYAALLEMLETAHSTLRSVFVGGQEPGIPVEWRIDGLLYRAWDMALDKAKTKLMQKFRASKFFAGQRRGDKRRAKEKNNLSREWHTLDGTKDFEFKDAAGNVHTLKENLGEAQYQQSKQQGFDVRRVEGRKTTYQFATRKEV